MIFPYKYRLKKILSSLNDSSMTILILISLIVFNAYVNGNVLETQKPVNIGIVNFLYIQDNGYDPEENAGTGIETSIIFPASGK